MESESNLCELIVNFQSLFTSLQTRRLHVKRILLFVLKTTQSHDECTAHESGLLRRYSLDIPSGIVLEEEKKSILKESENAWVKHEKQRSAV